MSGLRGQCYFIFFIYEYIFFLLFLFFTVVFGISGFFNFCFLFFCPLFSSQLIAMSHVIRVCDVSLLQIDA